MSFLLSVLALVAIGQPCRAWRAACCLFAGTAISFDLLCAELPGESYFLVAAATASVCAAILNRAKLGEVLQELCLVSVALNFVGWRIYEAGGVSGPYVLAFQFFYLSAILTTLFGGPTSADTTATRSIPSLLRPVY